jgi:zinc/manganese transport system permease protein
MSLGLGLLFLHFFTSYATAATALLFGDVLGVDLPTIYALLGLAALSLGILGVIARPLLFASLNPELAEAKGVSLRGLGLVFLGIVGLTTAACAQIVGVLLVFALMVGPAATAQRLSTRLVLGLGLAAGIALAEAWAGIALSYYTDWPASFWISALSGGVYLVSLARR